MEESFLNVHMAQRTNYLECSAYVQCRIFFELKICALHLAKFGIFLISIERLLTCLDQVHQYVPASIAHVCAGRPSRPIHPATLDGHHVRPNHVKPPALTSLSIHAAQVRLLRRCALRAHSPPGTTVTNANAEDALGECHELARESRLIAAPRLAHGIVPKMRMRSNRGSAHSRASW